VTYVFAVGGFLTVAGVPSLAGVLAVAGVPACIFYCYVFAGVTAVHGIPVIAAGVPAGFRPPCSLRYL